MFGGHDAVGASVGFAGDYRDFGDGGFGEGVEELGSVLDDSSVFLGGAGEEAGNVFEGDQGNVEAVAEADEAGSFNGGIDVQRSG